MLQLHLTQIAALDTALADIEARIREALAPFRAAQYTLWLSQPATVTFPSDGLYTIRVQVREDGVAFDQIVLSSDRYLGTPPGPPTSDNTIVTKE